MREINNAETRNIKYANGDDDSRFLDEPFERILTSDEINSVLRHAHSCLVTSTPPDIRRIERQWFLLDHDLHSEFRSKLLREHDRNPDAKMNSVEFVEVFLFDFVFNDPFETMLEYV